MNKKRKNGLIAMLIASVIMALGIYVIVTEDSVRPSDSDKNVDTSTMSTIILEDLGVKINEPKGATIELVEVDFRVPEITFNLHRPIVFKGALAGNVDAQLIMTKKINDLIFDIEKTGGSFTDWIDLGILWKQVDDYDGAVLAWRYAGELRPQNHVSYTNLGNIYHLYLRNYEKSEENFLIAIKNKPDNIPAYLELHSLYVNSYAEKEHLAEDVLNRGLELNIGNKSLIAALAQYKAR